MAKFIQTLIEKAAVLAQMHGGYASKQELTGFLATASIDRWNYFIGRSDEKRPGPHVGLNTRSLMALAPFMRRQAYRALPALGQLGFLAPGKFTLPDDCQYLDYYLVPGAVVVSPVDGFALGLHLADPMAGPTEMYPLVTTVENGDKQIYPVSLTSVDVQYYTIPPVPYYAETYDVDGNASYDDVNSVDVGWSLDNEPALIQLLLILLAENTGNGALLAVARGLSQEAN